jgi:uncharacterized membrane protein YkvA (DUF1232 family)
MASYLGRWKARTQQLRTEVYALYLAYKDPRTPWYAKILAGVVVGYAFSPIDLIPDFIPVLGYLDDLVLVPLGVVLVIKMIPAQVMAESRLKARDEMEHGKPVNKVAGVIIAIVWVGAAALAGAVIYRMINH